MQICIGGCKLFPLKTCTYASGLTSGSVKNTFEMRKKQFVGLGNLEQCLVKKTLLPYTIKLYNFALKFTIPGKKKIFIRLTSFERKIEEAVTRRVTLEHSRNMIVHTLIQAQMSLRRKREQIGRDVKFNRQRPQLGYWEL